LKLMMLCYNIQVGTGKTTPMSKDVGHQQKEKNMYQELRLEIMIALLLFSIIAVPTSLGAWGFCDGSFVFMGKTVGDTCTLAFMEIGYGECELWVIHYLYLGPGEIISERRGGCDPPAVPVWDTTLVVGDTLEWVQRFWAANGEFVIDYSGDYRLREPEYDSAFALLWKDSLHSYAEEQLVKTNVDEPDFNKPVELIWRHPHGLYKNYQIAEAIKTGSYIFIRTHQPLKGLYGSRHGLLLYRFR